MKKITIFLMALCITATTFAYRAKHEDLSKYTVTNYQTSFKDMNYKFTDFGSVKESPSLGYYNFVELMDGDKVAAYGALTHIKAYNKHEALLAIISPEGKLIDFKLPDANDKHQNVNDEDWKAPYIGKSHGEISFDGLAGSTYMARSAHAELDSMLLTFNSKKEAIVK